MSGDIFRRSRLYLTVRMGVLVAIAGLFVAVPFRQPVSVSLSLALLALLILVLGLAAKEIIDALASFDDRGISVPFRSAAEWRDLKSTATDSRTLVFQFDANGARREVRVPLGQFENPDRALSRFRQWAGELGAPTREKET
jgi:hypothetical protein